MLHILQLSAVVNGKNNEYNLYINISFGDNGESVFTIMFTNGD